MSLIDIFIIAVVALLIIALLIPQKKGYECNRLDKKGKILNIILSYVYIPLSILGVFMIFFADNPIGLTPMRLKLLYTAISFGVSMPFVSVISIFISIVTRKRGKSKFSFAIQFLPTAVFIIAIVLWACSTISIKDKKETVYDYVIKNETLILNGIDEIRNLPDAITLDYGDKIRGVGNAKINKYVDEDFGLYVDIDGLLESRKVTIQSETLLNILNGNPVENIGIDSGIIIFDCGGEGIVPSGQDYYFYYSPNDIPFAVFGGRAICDSSEMIPDGKGYKYIVNGDIFYTEKIKDNFYYCKASF